MDMKIKLIASIMTIVLVSLWGCSIGNIDEQKLDPQISNAKATQIIEQEIESHNNKEQPALHDGVYRTYSLGTTFPAGTILDLKSSLLLQTVEMPIKTAIYYNGELYKTIEFSNQDEEVELEDGGNYWIIVIDKENSFTDITDKIDYLVPSIGDSILFLQ